MSLFQWSTGDRITADRLNRAYNLFKGVAGGTDTLTLINGSTLDMSACAVAGGLKPPAAAGAAPTGDGVLAYDSTAKALITGNGSAAKRYPTAPIQTADIDDLQVTTAKITADAVTLRTHAVGSTSGPTTDSGSYADLEEMSCTIAGTGGDIEAEFSGLFTHSVNGNWVAIGFSLDGGAEEFTQLVHIPSAGLNVPVSLIGRWQTGVGSHTVKVRWCTQAATATAYATSRVLRVKELKR